MSKDVKVGDKVRVTRAGEFNGEVGEVVFVAYSTPIQACVRFAPKVQRIFDVSDLIVEEATDND